MNPFLDPSKVDPQKLMELSRLVQELPPELLSRMQTLMHNAQAGFDVRKDMEDFDKQLPPGFREKVMAMMMPGTASADTIETSSSSAETLEAAPSKPMDVREARLTILRAVAEGKMTPEEAEPLL